MRQSQRGRKADMKYKLEIKINISEEECTGFEDSLRNKDFDFFRYLADNNAKIKIVSRK